MAVDVIAGGGQYPNAGVVMLVRLHVMTLVFRLGFAQVNSGGALIPVGGCTCQTTWSWLGQSFGCGVCADPVTNPATVQLLARNVECGSNDAFLGSMDNPASCAKACEASPGCQYFVFGTSDGPHGDKGGQCYAEYTGRADCWEGWQSDSYNFYQISNTATGGPWCMVEESDCGTEVKGPDTVGSDFYLFREDTECETVGIQLGIFSTVADCADACHNHHPCTRFEYGKGSRAGSCYAEPSSNADCQQSTPFYDFYALRPAGQPAGQRWAYCETIHSNQPSTTCSFENDDECDSGTFCPQGTDIQDCVNDVECSGQHEQSCDCPLDKIADNECHPNCNNWRCNFDGGDCMSPTFAEHTSRYDSDGEPDLVCSTDKCNTSCECQFYQACDRAETTCDLAFRTFKHCSGYCGLNWPLVFFVTVVVMIVLCISYVYGCPGNRVSIRSIHIPSSLCCSRTQMNNPTAVVHAIPVQAEVEIVSVQRAQIDALQRQIERFTAAATTTVTSVATEMTSAMRWAVDVSHSSSEESRTPSPTTAPTPPDRRAASPLPPMPPPLPSQPMQRDNPTIAPQPNPPRRSLSAFDNSSTRIEHAIEGLQLDNEAQL